MVEAVRGQPRAAARRLRITEIFLSLQGETSRVGLPTVFVRLTGCPLRCQYCDTAYAFSGGSWMNFDEILSKITATNCRRVTVTGGEPLAQPACVELLKELCDQGMDVSLETSGALDVSGVDRRVSRVIDIKTPASGECHRNLNENLDHLNAADEVKFVICDRADYEWARQLLRELALHERCDVLFSPSFGQLQESLLADWIVEDCLPVRFQMQIHKHLWGDAPGR